ncbi:MAG: outer membrane protein transport protein [Bacteroidales bacterium]|nr:outer membrane protein transport protein [Bacteroidales bacterium]MCF8387516.1 outer membrane protein transport protein [Bacteroidales bacterium]MCF8398324.1 outer membrane protein transport protein [Bacteroidales bacterium]
MRRFITFGICLFLITSITATAGGYQVRLQGQKQTGIGLIGSPFSYDASSIFYNPGSLSFLQNKYNFTLGASGILSNHIFRMKNTDYEERTDNPLSTPFGIYGSGKITDKISIGVGAYTPYGSSAKWPEEWAGRYLVQDISLMAVFIQPTVSYQITDKIGIGAGFIYATGNVKLNRAIPGVNNAIAELDGNTSSIGFNVGMYFKPNEKLSFGVNYRSKIIMEVEEGDATFRDVPTALQTSIPADNTFGAELPLPANLDFGLAYAFNDKLTLAAEVNWVMWNIYDSLKFTFTKNPEGLNSSNPRLYEDSWITRIGAEYKLNEKFTFRGGIYYDPSPTNKDYFTPETVSLNTLAFTLGMTYSPVPRLDIDLSYLQLHGLEADKQYEPGGFAGTYKTLTMIPGIGLNYSF